VGERSGPMVQGTRAVGGNSTTINVNGVRIEGQDAVTITRILTEHSTMKNGGIPVSKGPLH
jgi:hypothetical protein